ncbi:LysR family transcriptional regulator [Brenneria populi]|uniref:LysR family transcriptional regulator n=1 Tax=Brenneria populi TaxID=1505588 RepID=A0ABU6JTD2_9GAMM|nr:LysR family transcriptional regulator [Brenneria populi Li et al. 2015]
MFNASEVLPCEIKSMGSQNADPHLITKMLFFINLVTSGSISTASEKMGVSISSGSRWLSDLEKEIGCTLYRRNNKNAPLTDAGEYLFNHFSAISNKINQLQCELSSFSNEVCGNIRICCTPVYANDYLIPVVTDYLARYPQVNFSINISAYGIQYWKDYDIIIGAVNAFSCQKEKTLPLVRRNLMSEPFITVATPTYLAQHDLPHTPGELLQHRCLYASSLTGGNEWAYEKDGERHFFKIPKSLEVCDSLLLREAVLHHAGIAYLPRYVVQQDIACGRLMVLLREWNTSQWLLNLYYPAPGYLTEGVASFKRFLLERHARYLGSEPLLHACVGA